MKWTFGNALIAVSLLAAFNLCYSKQAKVILNLGTALHYDNKTTRQIYIRAGKFLSQSNAKNYKAYIINKTHSSVSLVHEHRYYVVFIGPLHNAAEVRKIASNLLATPKIIPDKKTRARHTSVQQPVTPVVTTQKAKPLTPPKQIKTIASTTNHTTTNPFQLQAAHPSTTLSLQTTPSGFFLSVGGGEQYYRVSGDNSLNPGAGWPLDHYTSNGISNQPYFLLAGGYTFARQSDWLPYYSLGLEYMYASSANVDGYINQYSMPNFKNYNFQYDVQIMTILATLKADIYRWQNVMPYLLVGLGASNYSASNYSEQAVKGVTPRVNPAFGANASTNFSPSIGAGIDYILLKNVWLNVEFNYINYGKITTGNGANYATKTATNYSNESLNNSIFATSLLLGVTYYPR